MSPPRPSVSPLSNAQHSTKASPLERRNTGGDVSSRVRLLYDDDKSSSLSEPDDNDEDDDDADEEEEDDAEGEDQDRDQADVGSRSRQYHAHDQDVDSEAETERLEQTPRKMRNAVDESGRTPSKLAAVAHAEDDLTEPASPAQDEAGAASSTSTLTGKKRKRSDTLESPFTSAESTDGESKRKRSNDMNEDTVDDGRKGKISKGRKSKSEHSAFTTVDAIKSVETADPVEENEVEESVEAQPEEDPVRKLEAMDAFAQLGKQFMAFRDALIRERVSSFDAELALLDQPNCQHPEYLRLIACVDQRHQKQDKETKAYQYFKQNSIRQRTLGERAQLHSQYFQTVRDVRELALDDLGEQWYAIHRERRQGVNYQPEHNLSRYQFNDRRSDQLKQQAKYNHEVSILSGFAKYVGFPAAPDIGAVTGDALDNDLKAMRLARRTQASNHSTYQHHNHHHHSHTHAPYQPRQAVAASVASSERLAHEQFIERHAWARAPQYPTHHVPLASTPNISHTPEWAEHTIGFRKSQSSAQKQVTGESTNRNTFGTPSAFRDFRDTGENSTRDVDGPESATQSAGRMVVADNSPLHVSKHRHTANADKDAWRNYSGTSTIDAPLVEHSREDDAQRYEPERPGDIALTRINADPNDTLPRISNSQTPSAHIHGSTSLFMDDRPDIFRSAGFRPLNSSFPTTSGSVPSRS